MFGRCFCILKLTFFQTELIKNTWFWAYLLLFFPGGVLVVNTCIQVGYSGVVQGKLEKWPKLGRISSQTVQVGRPSTASWVQPVRGPWFEPRSVHISLWP